MLEPELFGVWSDDFRYGMQGPSDDVLIFKPDGTGRYEFSNWVLCSADFFRWSIIQPNTLQITGIKCLQVTEEPTIVAEEPSRIGVIETQYQIKIEETPSGKMMRVLQLDMVPALRHTHFGFAVAYSADWDEPAFEKS